MNELSRGKTTQNAQRRRDRNKNKMAGFRERERSYFPLTDISSVVRLFKDQLEGPGEPNLALLSITLGYIENAFTLNRAVPAANDSTLLRPIFPVVDVDAVEALYSKFEALVKGAVDLTKYSPGPSSRDLVKRISDVVWCSLSRNFKDRAHLQSLYSFLTGNKLDCFGVAFGVVAAAQVLGCSDIHLALSEDHAWVVFGEDGTDTAEVTWHGKGNEDKRGQSITLSVAEKSWLYLNGHAIICDRDMEVAALVSAANPSINFSMDSIEMGALQQELLWLLYDKGKMSKYPMALGNLGDLEEISPTPDRPPPLAIFGEAIQSSIEHYGNFHVYPYTYMGGYLYRKKRYREAIKCWAQAGSVIRKFNYTREDEEIYKEFLEIANELIPNIVKAVAMEPIMSYNSQLNILYSPEVYGDILRFYDGICEWEEGSSTPVLHVGWAQHLTFSLNKFDPRARSKVDLGKGDDEDEEDEDEEGDEDMEKEKQGGGKGEKKVEEKRLESKDKPLSLSPTTQDLKFSDPLKIVVDEIKNLDKDSSMLTPPSGPASAGQRVTARGRKGQRRRNSNAAKDGVFNKNIFSHEQQIMSRDKLQEESDPTEHKIKSTIEELTSKVVGQQYHQPGGGGGLAPNPNITALAQQCSQNILNKEYLLGAGEPFSSTSPATVSLSATSEDPVTAAAMGTDSRLDVDEFLSSKSNGTAFIGLTMDSMLKAESPADMMLAMKRSDNAMHAMPAPSPSPSPTSELLSALIPVQLELKSEKMRVMKKMFTSAKLNASAIKLQLTAQSQVHVKDSRFLDIGEPSGSVRKRPRREIV